MKVRRILGALLCVALLPTVATALPPFAGFAFAGFAAVTNAALLLQYGAYDREHGWDRDPRLQGRSPIYRRGFRAGFEDGRNDRDAAVGWRFGPRFRHPMEGYRAEFGDRRHYVIEFRAAYRDGYKEGYGRGH